jgi:hypothetical protein
MESYRIAIICWHFQAQYRYFVHLNCVYFRLRHKRYIECTRIISMLCLACLFIHGGQPINEARNYKQWYNCNNHWEKVEINKNDSFGFEKADSKYGDSLYLSYVSLRRWHSFAFHHWFLYHNVCDIRSTSVLRFDLI